MYIRIRYLHVHILHSLGKIVVKPCAFSPVILVSTTDTPRQGIVFHLTVDVFVHKDFTITWRRHCSKS